MIVCPLMSNPDVAREFNELKDATTSRAAYAIWSLNNGNMIDKAPNGEPSILFNQLLEYYKGDRKKAILAKSRVYRKSFLKSFGDWINPNNITDNWTKNHMLSSTVDKNGEPFIWEQI